jgi:hypothetical protein
MNRKRRGDGRPEYFKCLRIQQRMQAQPITSIAALSLATELAPTTIATSPAKPGNGGIVNEITGGQRSVKAKNSFPVLRSTGCRLLTSG